MVQVGITTDVLSPTDLDKVKRCNKWFFDTYFPGLVEINFPDMLESSLIPPEVLHITEAGRRNGASGYHVLNKGQPIGWVSPRASGNRILGHYLPARFGHSALYTPGIVSIVAHEIAEMIYDPNLATYTAPDSKGREWLLEVCDWVEGSWLVHTIGKDIAIFPNVALYPFKPGGPYDLLGLLKEPFTVLAPPARAFGRINGGPLVRIE